jgi:hypothetical protein
MKKKMRRLGIVRAVAAALLLLLGFPAMAGGTAGFDLMQQPAPLDIDKNKAIYEDPDPVGMHLRINCFPGASRWVDHTHVVASDEDQTIYITETFNRLSFFFLARDSRAGLGFFWRYLNGAEAKRQQRSD